RQHRAQTRAAERLRADVADRAQHGDGRSLMPFGRLEIALFLIERAEVAQRDRLEAAVARTLEEGEAPLEVLARLLPSPLLGLEDGEVREEVALGADVADGDQQIERARVLSGGALE